jgi:hypothetical protein
MPKVETEEPTVAAFVLLGLLPLAEDVLEAVCELLVSLGKGKCWIEIINRQRELPGGTGRNTSGARAGIQNSGVQATKATNK